MGHELRACLAKWNLGVVRIELRSILGLVWRNRRGSMLLRIESQGKYKASKILSSRAKPSCQEVWRLPTVMYSGGTPAECISPVAAETNGHTRDPSKQNT